MIALFREIETRNSDISKLVHPWAPRRYFNIIWYAVTGADTEPFHDVKCVRLVFVDTVGCLTSSRAQHSSHSIPLSSIPLARRFPSTIYYLQRIWLRGLNMWMCGQINDLVSSAGSEYSTVHHIHISRKTQRTQPLRNLAYLQRRFKAKGWIHCLIEESAIAEKRNFITWYWST